MAEITQYSNEYWALSAGVTGGEAGGKIEISTRGTETDVEASIDTATDIVQAWWVEATGKDYPNELPPPSSLQDGQLNDRLAEATEYMAASLEHEKQTENVRATRGEDEQRKYVFLEKRAQQLFDTWVTVRGFDEPGGPDGDTASQVGTPGAGEGKIGALIDLPGGAHDDEHRH